MPSRSERAESPKQSSRIIFVGPDPRHSTTSGHAGGQLTAAVGISGFAEQRDLRVEIVDTFVDSLSRPRLRERLRAGAGRVRSVRRLLSAGCVDAVMLFVGARFSFFERVLIAALARSRGVRTIFCIRDGAFIGWMQASPVLRATIPALLRVPSRIVVQGGRARDSLVRAGVPATRFSIVRNWLPASFHVAESGRTVTSGDAVRLIYVGWLVPEKGLRELMEACIELAPRHRFELDIVGGGPLGDELRATATANGFESAHFLGWLPPAEVLLRFQRAHVFVLPSYYEGFPNALLEAMACGLASVCTDVGAIADSVVDGANGFLVPPRNPAALAAAIERYLARPALISDHGGAAAEAVRTLHDRDTNLAQLFACIDAPPGD